MALGAQASVRLSAANKGSTTWTAAQAYRLGSQAPRDNTNWGTNRIQLQQASVDPEQSATFQFEVTAPAVAGVYGFSWQMVRELVHWFGQPSPEVDFGLGPVMSVTATLESLSGLTPGRLCTTRVVVTDVASGRPLEGVIVRVGRTSGVTASNGVVTKRYRPKRQGPKN